MINDIYLIINIRIWEILVIVFFLILFKDLLLKGLVIGIVSKQVDWQYERISINMNYRNCVVTKNLKKKKILIVGL